MAMTGPNLRFVPGDWAGAAAWFFNWDKMMSDGIGLSLGFTAAELVRIHDDYLMIQYLANTLVSVENFRSGMATFRRIMSRGSIGEPTPADPDAPDVTLPVTTDPVAPGIWQRNNEDIERVRSAPAYTEETGDILGIIPVEPVAPTEEGTQCELKVSVEPNYKVKIDGVMKGMDAIRIDYQRNGTTAWPLAGFLTNVPNEITITPQTPGEPESGRIRGVYIKDSEEFGQFSPEYPITVS